MFDAPPNLPVEPVSPAGSPPSGSPPTKPSNANMQGGINVAGSKEPEDIFADIKEPAPSAQSSAMPQMQPAAPRAGFPWKIILGIIIPLGVIGLGIGGYLLYQKIAGGNSSPIVADSGKEILPTTVPASAEPVAEVPVSSPVPEPDEDRLAASQASMALLKAQAEQELAAMESSTSTEMMAEEGSMMAEEASSSPPEAMAGESMTGETMGEPEMQALSLGLDSDGDGLTNSEETLLGSDPNQTDSDSDGYSDGSEVMNGYDPARPKAMLSESTKIKTEKIGILNFYIPSAWRRGAGPAGSVIIYTGTLASININLKTYTSTNGLMDYLIANNPGTGAADYILGTNNNGANVVYSKDKLSAWLLTGDTVFEIKYAVGGSTVMDFGTIFEYMLKTASLAQ